MGEAAPWTAHRLSLPEDCKPILSSAKAALKFALDHPDRFSVSNAGQVVLQFHFLP
jgi:hypothetical protein